MTYNEWQEELSKRLNWKLEKLNEVMQGTVEVIKSQLVAGERLVIDRLGLFTTRKQKERILVHAETKERRLMPPAIEVLFASTIEQQEPGWQSDNQSLAQMIATVSEVEADSVARFLHQLTQLLTEQMYKGQAFEYPDLGVFSPILDNENGTTTVHVNFVATGLLQEAVNQPFSHFESVVLGEGVVFEGIEEVIEAELKEETEEQPTISKIKATIATAAEQLSDKIKLTQEPSEEPSHEPVAIIEQSSEESVETETMATDLSMEEALSDDISLEVMEDSIPYIEETVVESKPDKEPKTISKIKRAIDRHPILMPIIGGLAVAVAGFFFHSCAKNKK